MSNSKLAPEGIEPLASVNPYRTYPWYASNQASSCNVWEFTVGELYGCVCHRPIDELARSPIASNLANGPQLTEQALKEAAYWDQWFASETSA